MQILICYRSCAEDPIVMSSRLTCVSVCLKHVQHIQEFYCLTKLCVHNSVVYDIGSTLAGLLFSSATIRNF